MPSPSKTHMRNRVLVRKVAMTYRQELVTLAEVAERFEVNQATARAMIRVYIPDKEFNILKGTRYHASKLGEKNPQYGNRWATDCLDGRGYLTRLVEGVRYYVHHIVMAEYLGIHPSQMPDNVNIHHIDENPTNNDISNLALTTQAGHQAIHDRYQSPGEDLLLKKLSVRECIEYMTLKSNTIRAM